MRTHILGFPSIGKRRELKLALESFWKGGISAEALLETSTKLKKRHWEVQKEAGLDYVTTGDFSLYDRMLDITCMLGAVPPRFTPCLDDSLLNRYFSLARGDVKRNIPALEMTKWFDTNYHYLVPEIDALEHGQQRNIQLLRIQNLPESLVFLQSPRSSDLLHG